MRSDHWCCSHISIIDYWRHLLQTTFKLARWKQDPAIICLYPLRGNQFHSSPVRLVETVTYRKLHVTVASHRFYHGWTALVGQGLLNVEVSRSHANIGHSVRLLWTRDQPVAQNCTLHNTTLTTDRLLCLWLNSNPQSQQQSCHRCAL